MGFLGLLIVVWGAFIGAWWVVSKYFKSSDLDRIKTRLAGTTKSKVAKPKKGETGSTSVIHGDAVIKNRVAQVLVERFKLGPKIGVFLEQAGLNWQPARLVHLTLVSFAAGFAVGWI